MRWIIKTSLRFRFLVVALARGDDALRRRRSCGTCRSTSSPSSRRRRSRSRPPCLGLTAAEVEKLVTVPMEQAFNGIAGARRLRSKSVAAALADRADLQAGHRPDARPPARAGAHGARAPDTLPTWAAPAVHDPAALGDQPGDEDRPVVATGLARSTMSMTAYWKIRARLLRVPGVANVRDLGRAHQACQVAGRPGEAAGANGVTLDQVMEVDRRRPRRRPAAVLRGRVHRHRRLRRHARTSGSASATCCRSSTPEDLAKVVAGRARRRARLRIGDVAEVVQDHQPLIGDAVINDGPGPHARSSRSCRGATRSTSPRASRRPSRHAARAARASTIDTTIFRPATFVEESIDNLDVVADPGLAARRARARRSSSSTGAPR